jgi:hypothetical protein
VLSAPRRAADAHEVQETLRTSAFPGEHVKAKWAGDLYLGGCRVVVVVVVVVVGGWRVCSQGPYIAGCVDFH